MQTIRKTIDRIEKTILVWMILGLAAISFIQVVTRYVFSFSFVWFEELARYLSVLITFLGAGIGVKTGSHFTMDLLVSRLGHPWNRLLERLISLISAVFFVLVSVFSWRIIDRMHGFGATSPTLGIPMYIAYLPIPIFCMVMAFRFAVKTVSVQAEDRKGREPGKGDAS